MAGEANVWQPKSLIEVSADSKVATQRLIATTEQSIFILTDFAYTVGVGSLKVYRNGLLINIGVDWVEQTTTSFAIVGGVDAEDVITAVATVGITGTVDVRDTDIFLSNNQALRDYAGTEDTIYIQGAATKGDGRESFFQQFTGAAIGFYVDDDKDIIVPTGGDGSIGWVRSSYTQQEIDIKVTPYATLSDLQADVANVTIGKSYRIDERTTGNGGGAYWKAIVKTTENAWNIVTGNATVSFSLETTSIPYKSPRVDAAQFGVIFDGTSAGVGTDNTAALQFLINFASNDLNSIELNSGIAMFTQLYMNYDSVNNPGFNPKMSDQIVRIKGQGMMDEFALEFGYLGTTLYSTQTSGNCIIHNRHSSSTGGQEANAAYFSEFNVIGNTSDYLFAADSFVNHARMERMTWHNKNVAGGGLKFIGRAFDFILEELLVIGSRFFWAAPPDMRAREGIYMDAEASQNRLHHCYIRGWTIGLHTVDGNTNIVLDRCVFIANDIGVKGEVVFTIKSFNLHNCHAELNTYCNYLFKPSEISGATGGNVQLTETNASSVIPDWEASTAYLTNVAVQNAGNFYRCAGSGTSAASGGPTGTGTGIVDGSTSWDYIKAVDAAIDRASINFDQNSFGNEMGLASFTGGYLSIGEGITGIKMIDTGNLTAKIEQNRFLFLGTGAGTMNAVDSVGSNANAKSSFLLNNIEGTTPTTLITEEEAFTEIQGADGINYVPFISVQVHATTGNINIVKSRYNMDLNLDGGVHTVDTIEVRPVGAKIALRATVGITFTHTATQLELLTGANTVVPLGHVVEFISNGTYWIQTS